MSKLDELFQEKLTHHTVTPSPEAWRKIEAGLAKSKTPLIWFRWAAVLLLGGILLSVLWLRRAEAPSTITESSIPEQPGIQKPAQDGLAQEKTQTTQKSETVKKTNRRKSAAPVHAQQEPVMATLEAGVRSEVTATADPVALPVGTETTHTPLTSPIVLIYTLESIEVSTETSTTQVVADAAKKDSSLKRVLEFANTVKNSESPLDNLRTAKEELFAFDFKKKTNGKKQ